MRISIRSSAAEYLTYIASVAAISQHIKRIYDDGEIVPEAKKHFMN